MPNKVIDIDSEFEDLTEFFDEAKINERTGKQRSWRQDGSRKKRQSQLVKTRNMQHYGKVEWVVRSPGCDLLEFYDQENAKLGKDNRAYSSIPPSVVFDIRFRMQIPKARVGGCGPGIAGAIRERCSQYKKTRDNTYWHQVFKSRYKWLKDEPHSEYVFDSKSEMREWLCEKFNQKNFMLKDSEIFNDSKQVVKAVEFMSWRGRMQGWSIVTRPKS
jgi:hypothetical protein